MPDNLLSLPPKKRLEKWLAGEHSDVKSAVLVFWAPWCGPCQVMEPVIKGIATDSPSVTFVRINTDDHGAFASECHVISIPTIALLRDGKVSELLIGVATTSGITEWLRKNEVIPAPSTA